MKRAFRYCRASGCSKLTNDGSGYCPDHQSQKPSAMKETDPFYLSPRWVKLSKWYRSNHPFCEKCNRNPSTMVHHKKHIKNDSGIKTEDSDVLMSEENLEALCHQCHEKKHDRWKVPVYTY
jgi:hypothetical protein